MSDTQQGPDWWLASDGKWYPPQPAAPLPPPPGAAYQQQQQPVQTKSNNKGCLIAVLLVLGLIGITAVGAIATIAFFGSKAETKLDELETLGQENTVDPADPDARDEDQFVGIGDMVELSGYSATVERAGFEDSVSELEAAGYLVADVSVLNRDAEPQPFSLSDWTVQTPDGRLISASLTSTDDRLVGGMLTAKGRAEGRVTFEIGPEASGDHFIVYKPDPFDAARGIWKVSL